jgi:7,8-dihydropterin-6-yl-methyl-4-(beta-D-ribofuranosyl)aminobenzene 5'-phosphate synthase
MRVVVIVIFSLWLGIGSMPAAASDVRTSSADTSQVSIVTVFDNYLVRSDLAAAWGFAAVVKTPANTVLFDTGGDGAKLLSNMQALGIDPERIDTVVVSHAHMDHLGGLTALLAVNPNVTVWIPSSFPEGVRRDVLEAGARYRDVSGSARIAQGIHSTGELGSALKEQSLIVDTPEGMVVITGCAHAGVVAVVKAAANLFRDRPIALVMGGFHLVSASNSDIDAVIRDFRYLGVRKVAPSHCSGDHARDRFRTIYNADYIEGGAGRAVVFR